MSSDDESDESIIIAAGEWLLSLCSTKPSYDRDQLLTRLEQVKFDEFFTLHGKYPVFKKYHVDSVRACLAKELRPDYQLARALLDKDATGRLFEGERDLLQVAIKTARVQPGWLGEDPKKSCPELLEIVKLLMKHGAEVNCLDDEGYSPLVYTCILGYAELFQFLVVSGADVSTIQKRMPPEQLIKAREAAKGSEDFVNEQVNLLQVTLDALISPQRIVDHTWVGWPPGVNYDMPLWEGSEDDILATWGGIILYLLEQGLLYADNDPGLVMLLHIACFKGSLNVVKKLLDYGVVANVPGPRMIDGGQGEGTKFGTAMHAAAAGRKLSTASELITRGESPGCRRHCIFFRRSGGDFTPVQTAIEATRYSNDDNGDMLNFVEDFMALAEDLPYSDYQDVLKYCAREKKQNAAKHLLERGIRLDEVPIPTEHLFLEDRKDDSDVEIVKLLVSYGIKLDPVSFQKKVLKQGQVELLRWCVNEYGPLLPSDPESWGEMVDRLFNTVRMETARYLITEYPGPHIDAVLIAKLRSHSTDEPQETSWLHIALVNDNTYAIRMLLEAGADPACPGLPVDAATAMRSITHRDFRLIPKRLKIIKMLKQRDEKWRMPSYAETRALLAETVTDQRRAWDEKIENMVKKRQTVPTQKAKYSVPSSPLAVTCTSGLDIYQPLSSSSSFRLLELLPSENRTDPLVGRLIDSDITFQPDYEALSYVWGDIIPVRYINLGDQDISITPNLHSALIHLRSPDTIRTLWVDALCINQFVHGERNQQVRIMGDIFKSARQVVVWLGEAADNSHLVFQHLADETIQDSIMNRAPPPQDKRLAWNALLKRPWFYRTWFTEAVIQLTGDLSILRHLGATREFEGLPSWVPDFTDTSTKSLPENNWYAPYRKDAEENYDVRAVDGTQYSIPRGDLGNKFLPGLSFLKDGGLVIKGKMVDTIREVGPELPEGVSYAPGTEAFIDVMKQWESLAAKLIPEWKSESSVTEAFARTLSATHGSELFSVEAGFTQWYRHCGTGILEGADPRMSLRDYEFYLWWFSVGKEDKEDTDEEEERLDYDLREFSDRVFFASYGRCLFTTEGELDLILEFESESGNYLGHKAE
ncbi:hypothetical protein F53441_4834 [Fusarium austroafricanum]|uniref:Heterokaryon incompatibility domain-containing protein n=1 Tax=Fusarium austroafricanum TaxID=2364996 RepID=A0A8H4KL77_9HYPO|nr:hypothetical protein F53441_4834 [Fusarium austroafricanum]